MYNIHCIHHIITQLCVSASCVYTWTYAYNVGHIMFQPNPYRQKPNFNIAIKYYIIISTSYHILNILAIYACLHNGQDISYVCAKYGQIEANRIFQRSFL